MILPGENLLNQQTYRSKDLQLSNNNIH